MGYGDVAGEQPVEQVPGQVRREADPETARVARRSHGRELARVGDEKVVGTGDADGEAAGGHPLDGIDQIVWTRGGELAAHHRDGRWRLALAGRLAGVVAHDPPARRVRRVPAGARPRPAERRVGKGGVSRVSARWCPYT